jgi:hypothetical protein
MRSLNGIVVHCTATHPEWWSGRSIGDKVAEVRRWHLDRGWSDVGYHYLIDRDGVVAKGRPIEKAGAHAKGHNANTVGICLFGGHGSSATDAFEDNFTPEQDAALRKLIDELQQKFDIKTIIGHNQVSAKACPGFSVPRWLAYQPPKTDRTSPTQSNTIRASAATVAGAAGTATAALSGLDEIAQYIILGFVGVIALCALFIMRERLKAWGSGWR